MHNITHKQKLVTIKGKALNCELYILKIPIFNVPYAYGNNFFRGGGGGGGWLRLLARFFFSCPAPQNSLSWSGEGGGGGGVGHILSGAAR